MNFLPPLSQATHPDYTYHSRDWKKIRDVMAGERVVKDAGLTYLPALGSDMGTTYAAFKERAVFVNMTARTALGMIGTIFRRKVKVAGVDLIHTENVTIGGLSLNAFAKRLALELVVVGRAGILVDMSADGRAYMTEYVAENILDWNTTLINGRRELSYVLLREIVDNPRSVLDPTVSARPTVGLGVSQQPFRARYRVCIS